MNKILVTLILTTGILQAFAQQPGTVKSYNKISPISNGPFTNPNDWQLGYVACLINDIDGDKIPELVTTSYDGRRNIYVFKLKQDGSVKPNYTVIGKDTGGLKGYLNTSFSVFATSVANIGDLDGNGVEDLVAGNGRGHGDNGEIFILFMNFAGEIDSFKQIRKGVNGMPAVLNAGDYWGGRVANIGDLDLDGVNDIAVGSVGTDNYTGSVWILFMNKNGTVKSTREITVGQSGFTYPLVPDDGFGVGITAINDLDKDSIPDIMVSALRSPTGSRGAIWALFLNRDGSVKSHYHYEPGTISFPDTTNPNSAFAVNMANIGDIDGDSVTDVAISAYDYIDSTGLSYGRVWICMLNTDGSIKTYQKIDKYNGGFSAPLDIKDQFGTAVGALGDFNKDGIYDMCVGAFGDDDVNPSNAQRNSGALYFLYLNGVPIVSTKTGDVIKNDTKGYYAYPNPANDYIIIRPRDKQQTINEVTIVDATGRIVQHINATGQSHVSIAVSNLAVGQYFIQVSNGNEKETIQFIKQ